MHLLPLRGKDTVDKLLNKHDVYWYEVEDAFIAADPSGWVKNLADTDERDVNISETLVGRTLLMVAEADPVQDVTFLVSCYPPNKEDIARYEKEARSR